jgi:hypothetical protein
VTGNITRNSSVKSITKKADNSEIYKVPENSSISHETSNLKKREALLS